MADTHQDLQNAIQAMNKIVAIRVAQKKHGKIVPKHIVEQIVESSDVAGIVHFIDTTIAREKETKLTPQEAADHTPQGDFAEEPTPDRPETKSEDSNKPATTLPLDVSDIQNKIQRKTEKSVEHASTDGNLGQTPAGEFKTAKPVEHHVDEGRIAAPPVVEKRKPQKDTEVPSTPSEELVTGVENAVSGEKDDRSGELTIPTGSLGEPPKRPLPDKVVWTKPPEKSENGDISSANEFADDSKWPVRLLVLCAILIALLSVFVTLNFSEITALVMQWFSSIEHLITNL